jgi:hypothetical protein
VVVVVVAKRMVQMAVLGVLVAGEGGCEKLADEGVLALAQGCYALTPVCSTSSTY